MSFFERDFEVLHCSGRFNFVRLDAGMYSTAHLSTLVECSILLLDMGF